MFTRVLTFFEVFLNIFDVFTSLLTFVEVFLKVLHVLQDFLKCLKCFLKSTLTLIPKWGLYGIITYDIQPLNIS